MKLFFPLDKFLRQAAIDKRLLPSHMSLFMAIFFYSIDDKPKEPFRVSRANLMKFSRIKSKTTYHKCLQELVAFGYITYEPSYNPYEASRITLIGYSRGVQF